MRSTSRVGALLATFPGMGTLAPNSRGPFLNSLWYPPLLWCYCLHLLSFFLFASVASRRWKLFSFLALCNRIDLLVWSQLSSLLHLSIRVLNPSPKRLSWFAVVCGISTEQKNNITTTTNFVIAIWTAASHQVVACFFHLFGLYKSLVSIAIVLATPHMHHCHFAPPLQRMFRQRSSVVYWRVFPRLVWVESITASRPFLENPVSFFWDNNYPLLDW